MNNHYLGDFLKGWLSQLEFLTEKKERRDWTLDRLGLLPAGDNSEFIYYRVVLRPHRREKDRQETQQILRKVKLRSYEVLLLQFSFLKGPRFHPRGGVRSLAEGVRRVVTGHLRPELVLFFEVIPGVLRV